MNINSNKDLFNTTEYENWANRSGLIEPEKKLFSQFLSTSPGNLKILELGTGNGRISFEIEKLGFTDITAIDISSRLIQEAERRKIEANSRVKFFEMNASKLQFENQSFDAVIALQQIICMIDNDAERLNVFAEIDRVLRTDGKFFSSFLNFNGRKINKYIAKAIVPIKIFKRDFKFLRKNYLPWLKLDNQINFGYLYKRQPYTYWYDEAELNHIFSKYHYNQRYMATSSELGVQNGSMLYFLHNKKL